MSVCMCERAMLHCKVDWKKPIYSFFIENKSARENQYHMITRIGSSERLLFEFACMLCSVCTSRGAAAATSDPSITNCFQIGGGQKTI